MTSDEKTVISSLVTYIKSDIFNINNISDTITITAVDNEADRKVSWECALSYLPIEFYMLLETYPNIVSTKKFDNKYNCNPKRFAYDEYGLTNMWRPIMILNRCPSILDFKLDYVRVYDMEILSNLMSVLISRTK